MYSMSDLDTEIEQIIEAQEVAGASIIHPDWVTTAIMSSHSDIDGEDADFYLCVSRQKVRDAVRKRINRYKESADEYANSQLVMEGFERLQKRYLIKDKGTFVAIRVQDMTSFQRRQKAAELRRMGAGCYQHADELDRYDYERNREAA